MCNALLYSELEASSFFSYRKLGFCFLQGQEGKGAVSTRLRTRNVAIEVVRRYMYSVVASFPFAI